MPKEGADAQEAGTGAPPSRRWAWLRDPHFWIPLGAFVAGVALLRWLA